jgi:hypothetical protein
MRLLAVLLDLQLQTVTDGSSTQQLLSQLSCAVLVVEAGTLSILSASTSILSGSSPTAASAAAAASSTRLQHMLRDLTPSAQRVNMTFDSVTQLLRPGMGSSCSAHLCKGVSAERLTSRDC